MIFFEPVININLYEYINDVYQQSCSIELRNMCHSCEIFKLKFKLTSKSIPRIIQYK